MLAPPSTENAWVKWSANLSTWSQSSNIEQQSPTSDEGKVTPAQHLRKDETWKDENKTDLVSVPKGESGNSSMDQEMKEQRLMEEVWKET